MISPVIRRFWAGSMPTMCQIGQSRSRPTRPRRPRIWPDQGQKSLDHGQRADQVDLELAAEVVERLELERAGLDDPGVGDEPGQAALRDGLLVFAAAPISAGSVISIISGVTAPFATVRAASASSSRRTPAKTWNPLFARRLTVAAPIPMDVPVTTTKPRSLL